MDLNLFLTGYRASGKSTVGSLLAAELGYKFIDLDKRLEIVFETSISNFVNQNSWLDFRFLETRVFVQFSLDKEQTEKFVMSLGGGFAVNDLSFKFEDLESKYQKEILTWLESYKISYNHFESLKINTFGKLQKFLLKLYTKTTNSKIIYLKTNWELIQKRLLKDVNLQNRPSFKNLKVFTTKQAIIYEKPDSIEIENFLAENKQVFLSRLESYKNLSDLVFSGAKNPKIIAIELKKILV